MVEDVDRDREFEERRLKIEREQELIYEQEEQHFREVVKIILNDKRPRSVFKLSQPLFTRSRLEWQIQSKIFSCLVVFVVKVRKSLSGSPKT